MEELARPLEVIEQEIQFYKQTAGAAILEIGRRLNEAKAQLDHGKWAAWLAEKVEFSEASAQRFMRLAREYPNPSPVTDLGASKALLLLALPENEREDFVAEKHTVNGVEKTVSEMSKRELEKAIKERDEANKIAEEKFQKEREKLQAKIDKLTKAQAAAEEKAKKAAEEIEEIKGDKDKANEQAENEIKALTAKIADLNKKLTVSASSEMTAFKAHFEIAKQSVSTMLSITAKDSEESTQLKTALKSFCEAVIGKL